MYSFPNVTLGHCAARFVHVKILRNITDHGAGCIAPLLCISFCSMLFEELQGLGRCSLYVTSDKITQRLMLHKQVAEL